MFIKTITKTDKSVIHIAASVKAIELTQHSGIVNLVDLSELTDKEDRKLLADRIDEIIRGEGGFV